MFEKSSPEYLVSSQAASVCKYSRILSRFHAVTWQPAAAATLHAPAPVTCARTEGEEQQLQADAARQRCITPAPTPSLIPHLEPPDPLRLQRQQSLFPNTLEFLHFKYSQDIKVLKFLRIPNVSSRQTEERGQATNGKQGIQSPRQKTLSSYLPLASNLQLLVTIVVCWAPPRCSPEPRHQSSCAGQRSLKNARWNKLQLMYTGVAHRVSCNPQLGATAAHTSMAHCSNRALLTVTLQGGNGSVEIGPCATPLGGWQFSQPPPPLPNMQYRCSMHTANGLSRLLHKLKWGGKLVGGTIFSQMQAARAVRRQPHSRRESKPSPPQQQASAPHESSV